MKTTVSTVLSTMAALLFCAAFIASPVLAQNAQEAIAASIAHEARPAEDVARDEHRRPQEVLEFAGLQPGMAVFEMESGGGYYTEILSRAVGTEGSVVMQNPAAFDQYYGDEPKNRAEALGNVRWSASDFDALDAEDESIDLLTWILGPHELWFEPGGVNLGDPATAFAEIARILKPGGSALLIDHAATDDSGTEVGSTLHRIREDIIRQLAEDAGLSLSESSDILRNPQDPLNISVFDESIRGHTNRFVLLFQK